MFSTFDLRLLLYVIRLAGWLKHCNLSLSLSLSQCIANLSEQHAGVAGRWSWGSHVSSVTVSIADLGTPGLLSLPCLL